MNYTLSHNTVVYATNYTGSVHISDLFKSVYSMVNPFSLAIVQD